MIAFNESLADAYVSGARNIAVPSSPGRQVRFLSGHAVIKDGRDMVAMLKLPMVKVVLTPFAMSWWPTWAEAAGTIKAEVLRPTPPEPEPESQWDPSLRPDGAGSDQPGS